MGQADCDDQCQGNALGEGPPRQLDDEQNLEREQNELRDKVASLTVEWERIEAELEQLD